MLVSNVFIFLLSLTLFSQNNDIQILRNNLINDALQNHGFSPRTGYYIKSDFGVDDFKQDAWDVDYTYFDSLLRSTGSGSNIDKLLSSGSSALISNDQTFI